MTEQDESQSATASRRAVLLGAGALGVTGVLAACGDGTPAGTGTTPGGTSPTPPPAPRTIKTSEVPVGGGTLFPERNIVVTQPSAGTFKAFSATCTHQGCQVEGVTGDTISCPCHGSLYNAADGSVKRGPAQRALAGRTVTVSGDTLTVT